MEMVSSLRLELRRRVEPYAGVPVCPLQHFPAGQRSHRNIYQRSSCAGQVEDN